jgi:hypothetical protein
MKLRHLFTINIFFAILIGGACALFPRFVFSLYGLVADDAGIYVTRLVGGSILGFSTLMWFGRQTTSFEARRAIALGLFIQDSIGLIASIEMQLTGKVNWFGWPSLALYGVFALGYAWFFFIRPGDC